MPRPVIAEYAIAPPMATKIVAMQLPTSLKMIGGSPMPSLNHNEPITANPMPANATPNTPPMNRPVAFAGGVAGCVLLLL